jgi:uncharacterized protein
MRFHLFPASEDAYFELFEADADNLCRAAELLLSMTAEFTDLADKADRLVLFEHEGDRITRAILIRLHTTFMARLEREDIFALATRLDDITDAIEEAGSLLVLHHIAEPFPAATAQARLLTRAAEHTAVVMRALHHADREQLAANLTSIEQLEDEGDRLYRRACADLYSFTGEHPARHALQWIDVVRDLEHALNDFARLGRVARAILLKQA